MFRFGHQVNIYTAGFMVLSDNNSEIELEKENGRQGNQTGQDDWRAEKAWRSIARLPVFVHVSPALANVLSRLSRRVFNATVLLVLLVQVLGTLTNDRGLAIHC